MTNISVTVMLKTDSKKSRVESVTLSNLDMYRNSVSSLDGRLTLVKVQGRGHVTPKILKKIFSGQFLCKIWANIIKIRVFCQFFRQRSCKIPVFC